MLKAFASSRLPARSGFCSIYLRTSSRVGRNAWGSFFPSADFALAARRSVRADRPVSDFEKRRANLLLLRCLSLGFGFGFSFGRSLFSCWLLCSGFLVGAGRSLAGRGFLPLGRACLFRNQRYCFFQCDACWIFAFRQGGVHLTPVDIRPIATVANGDGTAFWMLTKRRTCSRCGGTTAGTLRLPASRNRH